MIALKTVIYLSGGGFMFQLVLKELRERYKLSQIELVKKLNLSPSTIGM